MTTRTPAERHTDDIFNRRIDQTTGGLHTLAIAVIVGGFLRYLIDVSADAGAFRLVTTLMIGLAIELLSIYLIGLRRPENEE